MVSLVTCQWFFTCYSWPVMVIFISYWVLCPLGLGILTTSANLQRYPGPHLVTLHVLFPTLPESVPGRQGDRTVSQGSMIQSDFTYKTQIQRYNFKTFQMVTTEHCTPSTGLPSEHGTLYDCIGCTPIKLSLPITLFLLSLSPFLLHSLSSSFLLLCNNDF